MPRFPFVAFYLMALLLFGAGAHLPLSGAATTLVTFGAMALSGIVFLRHLVPVVDSPICLLVFGSILGMVSGRLFLLLTSLLIGPSFFAAAFALGLMLCAAFLITRLRQGVRFHWMVEDQHELNWLLFLNAAVLLAMAFPYWGVGRLTSKGYAFAPHFNWDWFNHITHTAELARSLPPQNSYFAGQTLHYYWFYYLWPAAVVNLCGVTSRDALILTLPPGVFLFVGALTCLARLYMAKASPRYLAISLGLFAFSYIGVFYFVKLFSLHSIKLMANYVNTTYSYLSHSWFRDFLYEPCSLTALTFFIMLMYINNNPPGRLSAARSEVGSGLVAGLLLGVTAITDLFIGMIAMLWYTAASWRPFLRTREGRVRIALASLVSLGIILSAFALQIFPVESGGTYTLRLGIHPITKYGPIYLLVELGPLFVFGVVGLYVALRRGQLNVFHSMLLLLVLALFVGFTVIVPYEPNVVIRKAIKVVQVPLVVFASVACSGYLDLPPRRWLRIAAVSVILAGSLTLLSDILQYVDPEPNNTTFVSAGKMQTLDWIRKRTAPDAIVQLLDQVRPGRGLELGVYEFDITINALGERRTLFGNYKKPYENHVANAVIENRRAILEQVYLGKNPESLKQNLDRLPPHYILVDSKSPGPLDAVRLLSDSGYLQEIFRSGEIVLLLKQSPMTGGH